MAFKESVGNVLHWNYRGFTEFPFRCIQGEEADITDIYLKENLISRIPNDIGKLYNLVSLYLSGNDITELPREISKLICLKCLDVSGNRLRCVPEEIGELINLKFLILDENELQRLPLRLAELRTLRYLSVCDNQLQWLAQRPVYNYYHCEMRFWRNPTLKTIPYSLWYHMFRGQQTRSLNIRSLQIPKFQNTEPKGRCLVHVGTKALDINFPPYPDTVIVNFSPSPPNLLELSKRKLYETIDDTAKKLTPTFSIYSDYNYGFTGLDTLEDEFNNVDMNNNVISERYIDNTPLFTLGVKNNNQQGKSLSNNKNKQYCVPSDIIREHFSYLPAFIKNDFCNGPISKCENICCKKPVFDYAFFEFCLEKIILIDYSADVILSTFCSKSCADMWKAGKYVLSWCLAE